MDFWGSVGLVVVGLFVGFVVVCLAMRGRVRLSLELDSRDRE